METFPRYWPFVRGIHRSPVNSPQRGQWRGALMFSLICVWINGWLNNREAGDLRRHRAHYDVIAMYLCYLYKMSNAENMLTNEKPHMPFTNRKEATKVRNVCTDYNMTDIDFDNHVLWCTQSLVMIIYFIPILNECIHMHFSVCQCIPAET